MNSKSFHIKDYSTREKQWIAALEWARKQRASGT
jgi:hypothetical protein